jgi:hypothetical protein
MNLRSICPVLLLVVLGAACHRDQGGDGAPGAGKDTTSYETVHDFLAAQLKGLDSTRPSLTLYDTHNGKADSSLISPAALRALTLPFLNVQAGPWSSTLYNRSTFEDSVHHLRIISYEAAADTLPLNRMDVSVDPDTREIRRLYIQVVEGGPDSTVRNQLIWKAGQSCTLITTVDKNGYTQGIHTQRVVWDSRP